MTLKGGKPAWLISHDSDVVFSLGRPDEDKPHHTVPAFEFFSTHREATPDEISEHNHEPKAARAARPETPAARPAKTPKAGRRTAGASKAARKAAPAAKPTRRPSADKPPAAPQGAAGGEPHGE